MEAIIMTPSIEGIIPPFKSLHKRLSRCAAEIERDLQILEIIQKDVQERRRHSICAPCYPPSYFPELSFIVPSDSAPSSPCSFTHDETPLTSASMIAQEAEEEEAVAQELTEAVCCICLDNIAKPSLFELDCSHQMCRECLEGYYSLEVTEGRTHITCPIPDCAKEVSAQKVQELLPEEVFEKFTRFSLKKTLKTDPHAHFCPAPDCDYAVIIKPKKNKLFGLRKACKKEEDQMHTCGNPACKTSFCLSCGDVWHPSLTCDENKSLKSALGGQSVDLENVKPCPKCSVPIFKLQDGSCNHMKCAVCETEFCWICMKEVNDLHYFSPSGCTFYAEKPWSTKKKVAFRTTIALAAPAVIGVAAVASVPVVMVAFPVKVGQKLSRKYKHSKVKRTLAVGTGVPLAILASPLVAAATVAVGVPALLLGTYVVFPVYLYKEHKKNEKIQLEKKLGNSTFMLDLDVSE